MIKSKFKNSKAQAAFEFLTTYGWAFLVILIMVGTLAYFGILTPSQVLPSRCTIGAEFQCLDHQVAAGPLAADNTVRFRLKNGVGESVTLTAAPVLTTESTTAYACTSLLPAYPFAWQAGAIQEFTWNTCNQAAVGIVEGNKGKVLITIRYYATASGVSYAKDVKGEVFTSVV